MLYKRWTTEEVDYLKVSVGNKKVPVIANQLRRTEKAVVAKMKRLGISQTKSHTGMLTMNELAKHLHVDPNTVKNWIDNHHLKSSVKITRTTRKFTFINPEDFWEWAGEYKSKVNFQKIDQHAILPEPEWVEDERKKKNENFVSYKKWTTKEIQQMLCLISKGHSFEVIGKHLGRSPMSVARKYQRINKDNRNST